MAGDLFETNRIILLHKQATSARVRFFVHAYGGICGFAELADPVEVIEGEAGSVVTLPRAVVAPAAVELGLDGNDLVGEADFVLSARSGGGTIAVHLARFTSIDPPFDLAERRGGRFVEMQSARTLPPNELTLLRAAYEAVMGG